MSAHDGSASVLRALLDAVDEAVLALDERGAIVVANAAAGRLLGHDPGRLAGTPLATLVDEAARSALAAALDRLEPGATERLELHVLAGDEPWTLTLRGLAGTRTPLAAATLTRDVVTTRPAHDLVLRTPHAIVALRPDRRVAFANAAAQALLGADAVRTGVRFDEGAPAPLRMLAARVVHVPAPLAATNVVVGARTLRVSGVASAGDEPALLLLEDVTDQYRRDRVMHEFLRNAAHQLRTPLAGITAAVETLQAGAKLRAETRDRFLSHIQTHAERLTRIARGLLALARAQLGEHMPLREVGIAPLLEDLAAAAQPNEHVTVVAAAEPLVAALASPDLLHELLAMLLENAVRVTRRGSIRLGAETRGDWVEVSVADTGPGIPAELRDRVFEPFFRLEEGPDGYGLGLAIAAQSVEAMGGTIVIDDTPGGGTTFVVTLRAAR